MASGRYPNNPKAVNALPSIIRTGISRAFLLNLDDNSQWDFLLNPQEIPYKASVNYAVGALIGVNQQPAIWTSTDGLIMELSDLILDTSAERKSVRAQIDRLVNLGKASPTLGRPPLLSFVCGEQSLTQCVIVGDIEWVETGTINGVAVRAKLSFTLRQVGNSAPIITLPTIEPIPSTTNSGGIPIPRPSQNPTPPTPTEPGTNPPPTNPPAPGGGQQPGANEAEIDKVGFAACIRLGSASAFAIGKNHGITAEHMVPSNAVGSTVKASILDGSRKIKDITLKILAKSSSLDAAYFEITDHDFDIYWALGDSSGLKPGDLCLAYGFPDGDAVEEKNRGAIAPDKNSSQFQGSTAQWTFFSMLDEKTRLLYPGNSGGAICAATGSQAGLIIGTTSGGEGRPRKTDVEAGRDTIIRDWKKDRVWCSNVSAWRSEFGI